MIYCSAFEDVTYTATGITSIDYMLYDGSQNLLFAGKAVARPNEGECRINVSDIARNYLNSDLPADAYSATSFNEGQFIEPNAVGDFTLRDGKGNVLQTYKFLNCWDYKTPFMFMANPGTSYPISHPANNHYTPEMYIFNSTITKQNKVKTNIVNGEFGDYCGYGALYYSNNMGGYDQFLIEGTITKKDNYERYTIENKWDFGTLKAGKRTLVNTIEESWTLKTHLLNDNEAKNLAENLFGSNNVYFHNFADNRIYPVNITDTSVEYKTRRNNKNKMFYLTINITSSQPKTRI